VKFPSIEYQIALCIVLLSVCILESGFAQNIDTHTIHIVDSLFIEDDRSVDEAKTELLNIARQSAIEQIVGVNVRSVNTLTETETNNSYFNSYQKLVSVSVDGKITNEYKIEFSKNQDYLIIQYLAEVSRDLTRADPYYSLSLTLNQKIYQVGDNLVLNVQVTKPSYIHIISIDEHNNISQLFPNYYMDQNFIPAGVERNIPNSQESHVLSFSLAETPGRDSYSELLLCIATKKPVSFKELTSTVDYSDNWLILNNWLMNIPRNEWTETYASYTVIK